MSVYSPYSTPDLANDQAYQRWAQQQRQQAQLAQQQATPQLGQMKQDTGWSSTPNTLGGSVDYGSGLLAMPNYSPSGTGPTVSTFDNVPSKPFPGSSPYGTSYSNPGAGWQPWNLYDGRNNYDGTANDGGYYNVAADTKKGWGPNGQGEFDRDRVWRMTLQVARDQGIDPGEQSPQNQAKVQQIFLTEVARLKRDYLNTPGLGAQAWANSAFSGYERLAQGGQPSGQPATSSTDQAWHSAIANASSTPGASTVSAPTLQTPTTVQHGLYDNSGTATIGQAVGNGAEGGRPGTPVPTTPGAGGMFNGNAPGEIFSSAPLAYRALLLKMGMDPDQHGIFSEYLKQRLTPILQAVINSTGANGQLPSNVDQFLADFGQQAFHGANFNGYLGGVADNALANIGGAYGGNADFSKLDPYIQSLLGLKAESLNPVAASGLQNSYSDTIGGMQSQGLLNGGADPKGNFLPHFQQSNFYKTLTGGR